MDDFWMIFSNMSIKIALNPNHVVEWLFFSKTPLNTRIPIWRDWLASCTHDGNDQVSTSKTCTLVSNGCEKFASLLLCNAFKTLNV